MYGSFWSRVKVKTRPKKVKLISKEKRIRGALKKEGESEAKTRRVREGRG